MADYMIVGVFMAREIPVSHKSMKNVFKSLWQMTTYPPWRSLALALWEEIWQAQVCSEGLV